MARHWFTDEETRELTTPVAKRIAGALRRGDERAAESLCDELRAERILLHDFFADATTALFTWTAENLGEERLYDMFVFCFEQSARRQVYEVMEADIKRGIEASLLARSCWVSHSCGGAGEHGGSFRIAEDDEKFTFIMDPCGSGGRLWRKGRYEPPTSFGVTSKPYAWSFGREGVPYYCVHCAFMNELLPYRRLGFMTWPVDPPRGAGDACSWHLYKDRRAVPRDYFERSGLVPPERPAPEVSSDRWFSEAQLEEMSRHTPDRILDSLRGGDLGGAHRACRQNAGEFFFLHSLYVNMTVSVLDFLAREAGEEMLGEVISYLYRKCVRDQLASLMESAPRAEAFRSIIRDIFLADTCGGAGFPVPRISIVEDTQRTSVVLDPCGSGGKLVRRRAYRPPGRARRARESLENTAIGLSAGLPLPRRLIEAVMPPVMDYISETRKPEGMGMTGKGYAWSGGREGVPYYCCLCTGFLALSGADWLKVIPPADRRAPCVWLARK